MPVSIIGNSGIQFPDSSLQTAAASPYVLKNRIINGAMVVDQRNAGASVTQTAALVYSLDRWAMYGDVTSKFSVQQNAGSVTPPAGFTNYLGATSLAATTVSASNEYDIIQRIEGFNTADLAWGTANAKTVILSFWVRSSLTGTFGGSFLNSTGNRSYVFSYTISSANTWTQISITIPGDTSGTWLTTNGTGIGIVFSLGVGSSLSAAAGSWYGAYYVGATGQVNIVGTSGATWYVTGVQLEQNTSATPFERRLYNQELANCQRYYERTSAASGAFGDAANFNGNVTSGSSYFNRPAFKVTKRAAPSLTVTNESSSGFPGTYTASGAGIYGFQITSVANATISAAFWSAYWNASAEL
jgi:hypothetical protein